MEKKFTIKDGREVTIRPLTIGDVEKSFSFFRALPPEDREFLRVDVTKRDVVEERIRSIDHRKIRRLVAIHGDDIVADGALEIEQPGWKQHVGEIRLIVARPFQRNGLGTLMARELFSLAQTERLEEILVKVVRPQLGARRIFRQLGFHDETLLPDYVKDMAGKKQDLILMRCDLDSIWHEWERKLTGYDWSRF